MQAFSEGGRSSYVLTQPRNDHQTAREARENQNAGASDMVRRKLPLLAAFPPRDRLALHEAVLDEILEERASCSRGRQGPRGVKRKMSSYPLRPRTP